MKALFDRLLNFILPLVRGEDRVCACVCGRLKFQQCHVFDTTHQYDCVPAEQHVHYQEHQVYHVLSYNGAQSTVDSRENYIGSDVLSRQEMNVIVGLLLGFCISVSLRCLDRVWRSKLKYWRENQMSVSRSWMPKFSDTRELFRRSHSKHMEDSGGNIEQDVHLDVNDT